MPISKVFNVDCLKYMKNIPDKYFDLAIVDPPYGINSPNMNMGGNRGYISTAERLRKGRLNAGGGKLKDRALQKMAIEWDYKTPSNIKGHKIMAYSRKDAIKRLKHKKLI